MLTVTQRENIKLITLLLESGKEVSMFIPWYVIVPVAMFILHLMDKVSKLEKAAARRKRK